MQVPSTPDPRRSTIEPATADLPLAVEPPVVPPTGPTAGHTAAPTPWSWRAGIGLAILALALLVYATQETIGPRGQSLAGVIFFFGLVAMFSANLRAVNWRTIVCGILLQMGLALLVLHGRATIGGHEYSVYHAIERAGDVVKAFIDCSDQGAKFVFGNLADPPSMARVFGGDYLFAFAFKALPPILFLSAFFTVLYHFGVLQACVRLAARVMQHLLRTSGAETLSVAANVFMGQTEAPLIVRPYIPRMTNSELFAVMTSGMAHISGGLMAVYISYGANPVAVLTTCVMACPCSLYLSKLFLPEMARPETSGGVEAQQSKSPYVNAVDAAASGTSDGLQLALNVAAMLIVFIAFVALFDTALAWIRPEWFSWTGLDLPEHFSLAWIFGKLLAPVAMLLGVEAADQAKVGTLLGYKLSINEHVAYLTMQSWMGQANFMSPRSYHLAAYALTGFANFSSVGIQLGGIGAMAPGRRHDLARLGMRALFVGFVATLLNASVAGCFSSLAQ